MKRLRNGDVTSWSWSAMLRTTPVSDFERASRPRRGICSQWDGIPDEPFMVLILDTTAMTGASGVARFRSEFDAVV